MIDEKLFSGERQLGTVTDCELNRLWEEIFGDYNVFTLIFYVKSKNILEWLKTSTGKQDLKVALPKKVRQELYEEAKELWSEREALEKTYVGQKPQELPPEEWEAFLREVKTTIIPAEDS